MCGGAESGCWPTTWEQGWRRSWPTSGRPTQACATRGPRRRVPLGPRDGPAAARLPLGEALAASSRPLAGCTSHTRTFPAWPFSRSAVLGDPRRGGHPARARCRVPVVAVARGLRATTTSLSLRLPSAAGSLEVYFQWPQLLDPSIRPGTDRQASQNPAGVPRHIPREVQRAVWRATMASAPSAQLVFARMDRRASWPGSTVSTRGYEGMRVVAPSRGARRQFPQPRALMGHPARRTSAPWSTPTECSWPSFQLAHAGELAAGYAYRATGARCVIPRSASASTRSRTRSGTTAASCGDPP